jgi:hypothetical protein
MLDNGHNHDNINSSNHSHQLNHGHNHDYKHIHIMMREFSDIKMECRCFYNSGLTAVSCDNYLEPNDRPEFEELIGDFFSIYSKYIPYKQCTIDLAVNIDDLNIYIIEFNSFGPLSQASAELFDWNEDYYDLYNSDIVTFKYKDEFCF